MFGQKGKGVEEDHGIKIELEAYAEIAQGLESKYKREISGICILNGQCSKCQFPPGDFIMKEEFVKEDKQRTSRRCVRKLLVHRN